MASSKFSANLTDEANQDFISNLPTIVTEKILKRLPIRMAARMSVLSTKWKDIWLSHRYLIFDDIFFIVLEMSKKTLVGRKATDIVSSMLFNHNGPLHKLHLYVPYHAKGSFILLSPWLSFISRTCVKKIALSVYDEMEDYDRVSIPYHFFECKELVKIRLDHFALNPPPHHFKGFANLRSLKLVGIKCKPAVFGSLIASCPRLTLLDLKSCIDLDHIVIDVPSLESLVIKGVFNYLSFKNVARLANISLCIEKYKNPRAVVLDSFKDLATSCELQHLHFGGRFSWLLAAGGVAKSFPLAFNHLNKVCFTELDLGLVEVYDFVFRIVQSCPSIKELEISVTPNRNAVQQKLDYDDNYKLAHLLKVKITGITGSQAELIFVEYLLAISVVLEKLFFECGFGYCPDANSELQLLRNLLQLPRTSPKAQLIWLKK